MDHFDFIQEGGLTINREYGDLLKKHRLNSFVNIYNLDWGELFKKNRYRSVVRFFLQGKEGKSHIFHLKRHHPPFLTRLKTILTGFRISEGAENEWNTMIRLEEIGIRTMTPVVFGAIRKYGLPYRSLTLTEHLYGAERLEEFLPLQFSGKRLDPDKIRYKRKIIRELARWARRFHGSGFHHQDFYLGHIFIKPSEGEDFTLHLIDLQRVKEHRKVRTSRVVKDLSQINFSATQLSCLSRTDRLRFLMAYLDKERLNGAEKKLIRKVENKTRRIALHTRKLLEKRGRRKSGKKTSPGSGKKSKIKELF